MNDIVKLIPETRWNVLFQDEGQWRVGIYKPEAGGADSITVLEKHTCPELFICMNGAAGLLVYDGESEKSIAFAPGEALLVNEYHNGYRIDEGAYFVVVERTIFSTDYIDRSTRKIISTVHI